MTLMYIIILKILCAKKEHLNNMNKLLTKKVYTCVYFITVLGSISSNLLYYVGR